MNRQVAIIRKILSIVCQYLIILSISQVAYSREIESVVLEIVENNLQLKISSEDNISTLSEATSANRLGNTSVEFSPFFQKGIKGMASSELIISQDFDFPTLYSARSTSGKMLRDRLNAEYDLSVRDLMLDTRKKCILLIKLNEEYQILKAREVFCDTILNLCRISIQEGTSTQLDLNKAKIDQMDLRAAIENIYAEMSSVKYDLKVLNGGKNIDLTDLTYSEPDMTWIVSNNNQNDPEIILAQGVTKEEKSKINVNRNQLLPGFSLGYRFNSEGAEKINGMLVGMTLPLFSGSSSVKAAKAKAAASDMELENKIVEIEERNVADLEKLHYLERLSSIYDKQLIDETLNMLNKSLELGEITLTEYYSEADRIYSTLQSGINAEYELRLVKADLTRNLTISGRNL